MSSIRLLVLGVVRFAQPVHGYEVRKKLQQWRLDGWVNVQHGSIHSALRTLHKDGFIATAATDAGHASLGPERTEFVLTPDGDKEFHLLLRAAWWNVVRGSDPFFPAICFLAEMTRKELLASLQARLNQLDAQVAELGFLRESIRGKTGSNGGIPLHVRENIDFATLRLEAEMQWARQCVQRLHDGEYVLAGEPGHQVHE